MDRVLSQLRIICARNTILKAAFPGRMKPCELRQSVSSVVFKDESYRLRIISVGQATKVASSAAPEEEKPADFVKLEAEEKGCSPRSQDILYRS